MPREISAAGEEAFRRLHELFGAPDPSAVPTRRCRRYVLEFQTGKPVFWEAYTGPAYPRSELELMLHRIFDEVLDNDIVPQKLVKAFPGSRFEPTRYGSR